MSQASTALDPITYYFPQVVKIQANQWPVLTGEEISNVGDVVKFEDDDVDNIVQNLRYPQDIIHTETPTHAGREEVIAVAASPGTAKVLHVQAILAHARIDAQT